MFVSAKNLLNFLIFLFVDFFLGLRKIIKHSKSLLILRLDSIGDYILFRNFLTAINVDDKYKDFRITLCGNVIWKELAEKLDSDVIDEFIWLDRIKFLNSLSYKISFLKTIYSKGFGIVINSTYTRELLFGDQIVKSSRAVERIGNSGSPDKIRKVRFFSDRFYTKLFESSNKSLFEFNRNLEFFELLLNKKLNVVRPEINYSKLPGYNGLPVKYCVVFPGSNDVKRRWNAASYAEICEYLISELGFQVVIPLAAGEKYIADEIMNKVKSDKLIDLSGKCSLTELAAVIAESEIVISNDTAAVHISAAVNKRFLCISNGSYFGRFLPYPETIFSKANYIFPGEIMKDFETSEKLASKYWLKSPLDINAVTVEKVKEKIKGILGDK